MTGRRTAVGAGLLVAAVSSAAGASLWACGAPDPARAVPTVTVKKTRFARVVDADGHLKPVKATVLAAPPSSEGPMRIAWLAEDGITVKKGDLVARFDDADLKTSLYAAQDDRATAAARKEKEALLVAQARNDRRRTTAGAQRELELGRAFARKDTELYARDDIIASEIDEKLQGARADHARSAQTVDAQVARRKLQMLDVEAKKAEQGISRAHEDLRKLELRAPHDGVLVFRRSWRGEAVGVGDQAWGPLAEISRSDELEAEVFVLEVEAAGLAKGKPAEIVLESHPQRVWKGEIARVETVAKRRQAKSPTQYFGVTLALEKTDAALMKAGQRARARLMLDAREALVVPRAALAQKDGRWIAHRRKGDGFEPVAVKLGSATAGLVAVEAGLADGDVIALRDPEHSSTARAPGAPGEAR